MTIDMNGGIQSYLRSTWDAALNLIFPPVCQICREERAGIQTGYVGGECWSQVRFVTAPFCQRCGLPYAGNVTGSFVCGNCEDVKFHFRFARSAVVANPLVLQVIHRYKYNRALYFEPFLADLLVRQAVPSLQYEKWDLIVPVPLHPAKEREREFNQAERLARHLSRATHIPVNASLLRRVKPTETQTHLNREERAGNVRDAFAPRGPEKLNGEKIILLDDVLTTGATTSACARVLRRAGAGDLCVWTVARGA
jgi:competence protein ComFC